MASKSAPAVFISYAHADNVSNNPKERWLDRFLVFLRPLVRQEDLAVYSDRDIPIGDDWHDHIQTHIENAKAVVLLISPDFLGSDYIANSELPVLLRKAKEQGTKILPILISPSLFDVVKYRYPDPKTGPETFTLSSIQAGNTPSKTLVEMTEGEQNRVFNDVAHRLQELLAPNPN